MICLTEDDEGLSRVAGASIFTFQKNKRAHGMAQTGKILAHIPPHERPHSCYSLFTFVCVVFFFLYT